MRALGPRLQPVPRRQLRTSGLDHARAGGNESLHLVPWTGGPEIPIAQLRDSCGIPPHKFPANQLNYPNRDVVVSPQRRAPVEEPSGQQFGTRIMRLTITNGFCTESQS